MREKSERHGVWSIEHGRERGRGELYIERWSDPAQRPSVLAAFKSILWNRKSIQLIMEEPPNMK
jgi:hypothetical protein